MTEYIPGTLIKAFIQKHSLELKAMKSCETASQEVRKTLQSFYHTEPFSPDLDLVVFGSIFRNEFIKGSDVDWTLHLLMVRLTPGTLTLLRKFIEKKIEEKRFGKAFSKRSIRKHNNQP